MSRIKFPEDYIKIEDKVPPVPYRTRAFEDNILAMDRNLTEREYAILRAVFTVSIATALAECVNPANIASFGDAALKQNYYDVFALAETLGLITSYCDCPGVPKGEYPGDVDTWDAATMKRYASDERRWCTGECAKAKYNEARDTKVEQSASTQETKET